MKKLEEVYRYRYENILTPLATRIENHIIELSKEKMHIDQIIARPKSIDSFMKKANKKIEGKYKYSDPINQIQDQLGVRIITFYLSDVEELSQFILGYFAPIELKAVIPDTPDKFGYVGKHCILFIPDELLNGLSKEEYPPFFELQIHTLFQHAWGEANHDLAYKSNTKLSTDQQRKIAFTAAQAWGADLLFNQLFLELHPN